MRKSIRKTLSLCLAMAMILSVLGIPAFAEERVIHMCVYDNYVSYHDEATPYSSDEHHVERSTYYACDCGAIGAPVITYFYADHVASGTGEVKYTFTDHLTGAVVYYVEYTCGACHDLFTQEEHGHN